ncbi:hypothetical protein [Saccharopolyspora hordei]|uniref:Uncharacterized protein n=1 Tax=Saccharopolyspora hordei TaxID=1838 RepID=A0A853AQ96_9PSEU|nr:hypothetical protein [Saccharopolyspora hordei]NYI82741.1 hypothetical protein [Saccharopolyspora hordei]
MTLVDLALEPNTYLALFLVSSAVLGVLVVPIRGGNGQHAGAGPGTVMVWQLRDAITAERASSAIPGGIARPRSTGVADQDARREPPAEEYVGRHRLAWDVDEHSPCPVDLRLGPGFPWSVRAEPGR